MKGIGISLALSELSHRESEVLELASLGHKDNSICHELGIAPGTLGTYWGRIRNKTELVSRPELVAAYASFKADIVLANTIEVVAELVVTGSKEQAAIATRIFHRLPVPGAIFNSERQFVLLNSLAKSLLTTHTRIGMQVVDLETSNRGKLLADIFKPVDGPRTAKTYHFEVLGRGDQPQGWLAKRIGEENFALMISKVLLA